jgi:hypothetical protein
MDNENQNQPEPMAPVTSIVQSPAPALVLTSMREQALSLLQFSRDRTVKSLEDTKVATEDLSIIANSKKVLEAKRKEYVTPLNDQVKLINDTFKLVSEPLNEADKITRDKVLAFRAEQERLRREAEEINQAKLDLAQREAALNQGAFTVDTTPVEVAPEQPKHINTDFGTAGTMTVRKWELEDLSKVPIDYLMIDAAKVGKVVRAGIPSIPGIRIFEDQSLRVTTR